MILSKLRIENFRGLTSLEIELDRTTVLVGENNTGKTSVLEALHIVLSRSLARRAAPFTEYDFHLATDQSEPASAEPIALTVIFEESNKDEWPDEIVQAFPNAIQTFDDGRQLLSFRVTASYDKVIQDVAVEWAFLDQAGNPLPTAKQTALVTELQQLAPVFLLSAVRDAAQHFGARSSFWSPFTKNPDIAQDRRAEIEEQIAQVNQSVLDSHKPFEVVRERIAQVGKLVPLAGGDLVSVEAVPGRILDMLSRTQVKLAARTGARLPLAYHGSGTQSLSVLFLFEAFLLSRLAGAYDTHSEPILALEEPEAHLHPSAIRALWSTLDSLGGQKIIATHSGDLLAAVPLQAIRRLARKSDRIQVFRVGSNTLDSTEARRVIYHIRAKRGALLFARCWLLVEGETEFTLLPELARILGHDLDLTGVCCVEFAQCGLRPLIKVAKDLGIEWHVLADGDRSGQRYAATARSFLGGENESVRITGFPEPDIEHSFWNAGYESVYETAVDANHTAMVTASKGTAQYTSETINAAVKSTSKPHLAYAVASEAAVRGPSGIPSPLKVAIETAVTLAAT